MISYITRDEIISFPEPDSIAHISKPMVAYNAAKTIAADYVSQLDRSRLGIFAVSAERLIKVSATSLMWSSGFVPSVMEALGEADDSDFYVTSEVSFWRSMASNKKFMNSLLEKSQNDEITYDAAYKANNFLKCLLRIYSNPTYLPYFEAGIWEATVIDLFIANKVDASLAVELQRAA